MAHLQYVDINISPADYKDLTGLLVTKMFLTHQGEGPFAGRVAVFIRLAGCDKGDKKSCVFCDTNFLFHQGVHFTPEEILKKVRELYSPCFLFSSIKSKPLIVITGGEPMLQDNIVPLIKLLHSNNYHVQIESNGDRLARDFIDDPACLFSTLVVSPKVTPRYQQYPGLKRDIFDRVDNLKFVVEDQPSSPYYELPPYIFEWVMKRGDATAIYVSPITVYKREVAEGEIVSIWKDDLIDRDETARNYAYAAKLCIKYGYTFSCQTHTFTGAE
jgi:7-carboxy-7-deazaguanine synthase